MPFDITTNFSTKILLDEMKTKFIQPAQVQTTFLALVPTATSKTPIGQRNSVENKEVARDFVGPDQKHVAIHSCDWWRDLRG